MTASFTIESCLEPELPGARVAWSQSCLEPCLQVMVMPGFGAEASVLF
jgi:hypothetical protein